MRAKYVGNKGDKLSVVVRNGEVSASIPRGTPVIAILNGTNDGLDVVLPSTAGAALSFNARLGVVSETLTAGAFTDSIVYGYVAYALITRMTRSASSASWTSSASAASGVCLGIDILNNAFLLGASSDGSLAAAAANAFLVDSLASSAASATATSDTRTAITNGVRVFVRML